MVVVLAEEGGQGLKGLRASPPHARPSQPAGGRPCRLTCHARPDSVKGLPASAEGECWDRLAGRSRASTVPLTAASRPRPPGFPLPAGGIHPPTVGTALSPGSLPVWAPPKPNALVARYLRIRRLGFESLPDRAGQTGTTNVVDGARLERWDDWPVVGRATEQCDPLGRNGKHPDAAMTGSGETRCEESTASTSPAACSVREARPRHGPRLRLTPQDRLGEPRTGPVPEPARSLRAGDPVRPSGAWDCPTARQRRRRSRRPWTTSEPSWMTPGRSEPSCSGMSQGVEPSLLFARRFRPALPDSCSTGGWPGRSRRTTTRGLRRSTRSSRRTPSSSPPHGGTETTLDTFAPSVADDPRACEWMAKMERSSASPGDGPGPVSHGARHRCPSPAPRGAGADPRHAAGGPGSQRPRRPLDGIADSGGSIRRAPRADHQFWWQNGEAVAGEVEEFVTGTRSTVEDERVLATVLFTDIIRSTERATALGDQRWRRVLDEHDRTGVAAYRGRRGKAGQVHGGRSAGGVRSSPRREGRPRSP